MKTSQKITKKTTKPSLHRLQRPVRGPTRPALTTPTRLSRRPCSCRRQRSSWRAATTTRRSRPATRVLQDGDRSFTPTGVKTGEDVRVTTAGEFKIFNLVGVPGVVGDETEKESDVKMTAAGRFKISPLEKVQVTKVTQVGDETKVVTKTGIFTIINCVKKEEDEKIKRMEESLKIILDDSEDEFPEPEIVKVSSEDQSIMEACEESKKNMVTIRRDWKNGFVTYITHSTTVVEPDDTDDVVFVEEIRKR